MNVNGLTPKSSGAMTARFLVLGWTGALLLGFQPSQAATSKKHVLTLPEARTLEARASLLAANARTWSTVDAPNFTLAMRRAIWEVLEYDTKAQALASPMIEYLEWRRSLDPARFTYYHPRLSPALAELLDSSPVPSTASLPTPTAVSDPSPAPQTLSPSTPISGAQATAAPAVPEPSSLLLAVTMTAWGIWWRHRIAQRAVR
jgi:hypothetical protein